MAPRKQRNKEEIELLKALRFVSKAQQSIGTAYQTHCRLAGNYVVAYDGVFAAGYPTTEVLADACPHTLNFIAALEKANDVSAITFDANSVTVKTSKFKAIVPCISTYDLMFINPDPNQYLLSDEFAEAAKLAAIYTREGAQTVVAASIMTRNGSLVGSDGRALIEVWHGSPTPAGLIIPKSFVDAMSKTAGKIVGFGYTETSFTVWYEGGAWIKTQLYSEQWPSIDRLLAYTETSNPTELDKDFWNALRSVASFSEDGDVYFLGGFVCSHASTAKGAEYKLNGIPGNQCYSIKLLLALEGIATKVDWEGNEIVSCFFGEKIRGVLAKKHFG